jgi:protein MpaA
MIHMYLFRSIRFATFLTMATLILSSCSSSLSREAVSGGQDQTSKPGTPVPKKTILDGQPSSGEQTPETGEKSTLQDMNLYPKRSAEQRAMTMKLCEDIGSKLGSVSIDDCLQQQLIHSELTIQGRSLAYREYPPLTGRGPLGKVLVIGGIHGDEFSSVSVLFKWMNILNEHHSGLFHWRFVPVLNPDGLLRKKSQRQNHNGVDLNRNFPTTDWEESALAHWRTETHKNPRRHPGEAPASEPETKWLVKQISIFKPDVIISIHAPYHLVDYDGPPSAPKKLGTLYLRDLGVFPGSLGNYAGTDLNVPIVTVELKSAGIMPPEKEIDAMWSDLVRWLRDQLSVKFSDYETSEDDSELTLGQ